MPGYVTWTLSGPVVVSPLSPPTSLPPIVGSVVSCDAQEYSQADLLLILDRAYPDDYVDAMKEKPDGGYELFQAAAAVAERVSIAVGRRYCCSFVISAPGGVKATGQVEFYREDTTWGACVFKAGTIVATADGRGFVTLADATFGALDVGPHTVAIEAVAEGYEWNVPGQVSTLGGETIPGDISVIQRAIVEDSGGDPYLDPFMLVRNVAATSGGVDKCLDALGQDLGMPRNVGELDEPYRYRIQNTPDAISPLAIERGVNEILQPLGYSVCLREVGTPKLKGFFFDAGSSADSPQVRAHNFAYDLTPHAEDRYKVLLSRADMRGFFLVGVPRLIVSDYPGLVFDGSTGTPHPLKNAFDTTEVDSVNAAYDAEGVQNSAIYQAISDTVRRKKAGGVGFDLYLEEIGCF